MSATARRAFEIVSSPTEANYGPLEVRHWASLDSPATGFGVYYRRPNLTPAGRAFGVSARVPRMAGTLLHLGDFDTFDAACREARYLAAASLCAAFRIDDKPLPRFLRSPTKP